MAEAVQETETAAGSEMEEPRWAVISFERCEGANLTYSDAAELLSRLEAEGISGLCVVADDVAARLAA